MTILGGKKNTIPIVKHGGKKIAKFGMETSVTQPYPCIVGGSFSEKDPHCRAKTTNKWYINTIENVKRELDLQLSKQHLRNLKYRKIPAEPIPMKLKTASELINSTGGQLLVSPSV